jgi:uncharacterized protein
MTSPARIQVLPATLGLMGLALVAVFGLQSGGWAMAALAMAGALAGVSLFQASFGFTASWRALVMEGRTHGLRIQLLMFAVAGVAALSLINWGDGYRGSLAPIGVAVVSGAFLFGIGMQVAGACASGAIFAAGGGSLRSLVTLVGFVLGVTAAVISFDTWSTWPIMPTVSLTHEFGKTGSIIVHLALVGAAFGLAMVYERRRRGHVAGLLSDRTTDMRFSGRWPLLWGAIGLGLAALLILVLSGRPWALISAYALWGSKLVALTGEDVTFWGHWAANPTILEKSIFADTASVVDLGAFAGALLAAGLTGRFAFRGGLPLSGLAVALIGGIIMGFGARLSVGCNIGAFFSGIISGSMHGWVWGVFALAGTATALGVKSAVARVWSNTAASREAVATTAA